MNILGIETSTRRAGLAIAADGALLAEVVLPDAKSPSAQLVPALDGLLKECGFVPRDIGGIAVGTGPGSFTGIRIGLATARGLSIAHGILIRGVGGFDSLLAGYAGVLPGSRVSSPSFPPFLAGEKPSIHPLPPRGGGIGRGGDATVTEGPHTGDAARICPFVDAHSYGVYAAVYEREGAGYRRVKEPFVCTPDELPRVVEGEVYFMGPHLGRFRELLAGLFGPRGSFDAEDRFPAASTAALLFDSPAALRDEPPGTVAPLYLLPGVRVKSVTRKP